MEIVWNSMIHQQNISCNALKGSHVCNELLILTQTKNSHYGYYLLSTFLTKTLNWKKDYNQFQKFFMLSLYERLNIGLMRGMSYKNSMCCKIVNHTPCIQWPWHRKLSISYGRVPALAPDTAVNSGKGAKGTKNQKTTFSQEILNAISSITQKSQPLVSTKQKGTKVI